MEDGGKLSAFQFITFLCKSREGFSPAWRLSRHGRGSNHDACGHKKRCNILPWKYTI